MPGGLEPRGGGAGARLCGQIGALGLWAVWGPPAALTPGQGFGGQPSLAAPRGCPTPPGGPGTLIGLLAFLLLGVDVLLGGRLDLLDPGRPGGEAERVWGPLGTAAPPPPPAPRPSENLSASKASASVQAGAWTAS